MNSPPDPGPLWKRNSVWYFDPLGKTNRHSLQWDTVAQCWSPGLLLCLFLQQIPLSDCSPSQQQKCRGRQGIGFLFVNKQIVIPSLSVWWLQKYLYWNYFKGFVLVGFRLPCVTWQSKCIAIWQRRRFQEVRSMLKVSQSLYFCFRSSMILELFETAIVLMCCLHVCKEAITILLCCSPKCTLHFLFLVCFFLNSFRSLVTHKGHNLDPCCVSFGCAADDTMR